MRCTCLARGDEFVQWANHAVPLAEEEVGKPEIRRRESRALAVTEAFRQPDSVLVELPAATEIAHGEGLDGQVVDDRRGDRRADLERDRQRTLHVLDSRYIARIVLRHADGRQCVGP